jgi:hypothetical protein
MVNSLAARAAWAFLVGVTVLFVSAGCASPEEVPEVAETVREPSQADMLAERIASRPAVGSPEYDALMKEIFWIPYIEGQDPKETLTRSSAVFMNLLDAPYADAPQNTDDLVKLMIEETLSVNDIAETELQPDYYLYGFGTQVFGKDYASDPYASVVVKKWSEFEIERTKLYLSDGALPNRDLEIDQISFIKANATDIYAYYTTKFDDNLGGGMGISNVHLKAFDTDGDGQYDSWHTVGTGDGQ